MDKAIRSPARLRERSYTLARIILLPKVGRELIPRLKTGALEIDKEQFTGAR